MNSYDREERRLSLWDVTEQGILVDRFPDQLLHAISGDVAAADSVVDADEATAEEDEGGRLGPARRRFVATFIGEGLGRGRGSRDQDDARESRTRAWQPVCRAERVFAKLYCVVVYRLTHRHLVLFFCSCVCCCDITTEVGGRAQQCWRLARRVALWSECYACRGARTTESGTA